jgi:hypothetical protein
LQFQFRFQIEFVTGTKTISLIDEIEQVFFTLLFITLPREY